MADELVRSATRKAARRLIPFLFLCYTINFLDRVNVGFAALAMNEDIGLSPAIFGAGAGIFFIGYLLFEIPSNLALQKFGARVWIARIMISWGIVAMAMALVAGPTSFYVMRFLLGVAEAGFFPGIILYLTYWFPMAERARIVSLFMAAVPIATVVGAPVSGALLEMHGIAGLAGWQWMFIIEGLPAVLLGFVALRFLTDRPSDAAWLTAAERAALAGKLAAEAEATREIGYAGLGEALIRPRVLVLALLYFCIVVGLYGIGFWMPQVIQTFGLDPLAIGFLTAVPYLFASVVMVLAGMSSDRSGERTLHVAVPLLIGAAAFAWSATAGSLLVAIVALTFATAGIYAAIGTFWSFPTAILTGTAAAAGLAFVNATGNLGGLLGPTVIGILKEETGSFASAMLFLAGAMACGGVIALMFGWWGGPRTTLRKSARAIRKSP